MMEKQLDQAYGEIMNRMKIHSPQENLTITDKNVYQERQPGNRPHIDAIVSDLLLPGSGFLHFERFIEFYKLAQSGKSCLLLMEHYSNFDIPVFFYLLEKEQEWGQKLSDSLVMIAGMKLNEESPRVFAFTEAYTRIVIYPSRSIAGIKDPELLKEEEKKSKGINLAAMKELIRCKNSGKIILLFPSGTRYRPWDPSSKKGVKEVDTYLKTFDYMMMVGINGNILRLNERAISMVEDIVEKDVVLFTCGEPMSCTAFRDRYKDNIPSEADPKQFIVDRIMDHLDALHTETEPIYQDIIAKVGR